MIRYTPHTPGAAHHDHTHGFDSFAHCSRLVRHLGVNSAVASDSPSNLRYWPEIVDDSPANRAEVARRIVAVCGENFDRHAYGGKLEIFWLKNWLADYRASAPTPDAVKAEVARAVG